MSRQRWWAVAAGLAAAAAGWSCASRQRPAGTGPVARTDESFRFTARAPVRRVFPLFGAWAERAWAGPEWNPTFLYPDPPADEEGAVFTVPGEAGARAIWVNTTFDPQRGRVQYVYVVPGMQAVLIDLALSEHPGGDATDVEVRYRRTALHPGMNARIGELGRRDARAGTEWDDAVNAALLR